MTNRPQKKDGKTSKPLKSKTDNRESNNVIAKSESPLSSKPKSPWSWFDEGRRLSTKNRNVYHDTIEKDGTKLHVGDCAVFHSPESARLPYIGHIDSMWQTTAGNMKVRVRWLYHAEEVEGVAIGGRRVEQIKTKGAVFESNHFDENYISCISHPCNILPLADVRQRVDCDGTPDKIHYLAGHYDPVEGVVSFGDTVF